jgi:hypothetical protein
MHPTHSQPLRYASRPTLCLAVSSVGCVRHTCIAQGMCRSWLQALCVTHGDALPSRAVTARGYHPCAVRAEGKPVGGRTCAWHWKGELIRGCCIASPSDNCEVTPYDIGSLPCLQDEAPYSSVYRPAQPLATLVAGEGTAAGAGGSQGVWTLTVTDTAATK